MGYLVFLLEYWRPPGCYSNVREVLYGINRGQLSIMRFASRYIWLFIALLLPLCGWPQKFLVTVYNTGQGLPSNHIRQAIEDSLGFLWIATDAGPLYFNGQQFSNYRHGLKSASIQYIQQRADGRLWLSTDAGLAELSRKGDTPIFQSVLPAGEQALYYPNRMYEDAKGRVWISQPNASVAKWDGQRLKLYRFGGEVATGSSGSGFFFGEGPLSNFWVGSNTGHLFLYQEESDSFQLKGLFPPFNAWAIRDDSLWLAGEGLHLLRIEKNQHVDSVGSFDTGGRELTCLAWGRSGEWYAGTNGEGFFRLSFQGQTLTFSEAFGSNDPHRVDRLPFKTINDIHMSPSGDIWLSTNEGLGLLQPRFFEGANGVSFNNTTIVAAIQDRIYASFGHVYEIEKQGREFYGHTLPGLERGSVNGIAATSKHLWMSTTDGELFTYENGRTANLHDLTGRGGGIFSLLAGSNDDLWFCQAPRNTPLIGLAKIKPNMEIQAYGADKGMESRILTVRESERGTIYAAGIGAGTYLYRYLPELDNFLNLSLPLPFPHSSNFEVHDMAIGPKGLVWLASTDGLLRFDLERIQRVDLGPYTSREIRAVAILKDGSLWLATDTEGLLFYNNGHYVLVGEASGLPSRVAAYRCLVKDSQEYLWVGTAEGMVHSSRPNPKPAKSSHPILLQTIINGTEQKGPPDDNTLPPYADIHLQFACPAYPGEGMLYEYRLRGSPDSTWRAFSPQPGLSFTKQAPGDYLLEARARQAGGFDWSEPLQWRFQVEQHWYRTPWAKAGFLTVGILLLWGLIRLRMHQLRIRVATLQQSLAKQHEEYRQKESFLQQKLETATQLAERPVSNLEILFGLIQSLPQESTLEDTIKTMAKALREPIAIIAFEFAYLDKNELVFRGYSRRAESFNRRREEFNEKTNLAAWAIAGNEPLLLTDFSRQQELYIEKTGDYRYNSVIVAPFELRSGKRMALCLYHLRKNAFNQHDLMAAQMLARYLSLILKRRLE